MTPREKREWRYVFELYAWVFCGLIWMAIGNTGLLFLPKGYKYVKVSAFFDGWLDRINKGLWRNSKQ